MMIMMTVYFFGGCCWLQQSMHHSILQLLHSTERRKAAVTNISNIAISLFYNCFIHIGQLLCLISFIFNSLSSFLLAIIYAVIALLEVFQYFRSLLSNLHHNFLSYLPSSTLYTPIITPYNK